MVDEMATKLAVVDSEWGTEPAAVNIVGVLEYKLYFALVFIL